MFELESSPIQHMYMLTGYVDFSYVHAWLVLHDTCMSASWLRAHMWAKHDTVVMLGKGLKMGMFWLRYWHYELMTRPAFMSGLANFLNDRRGEQRKIWCCFQGLSGADDWPAQWRPDKQLEEELYMGITVQRCFKGLAIFPSDQIAMWPSDLTTLSFASNTLQFHPPTSLPFPPNRVSSSHLSLTKSSNVRTKSRTATVVSGDILDGDAVFDFFLMKPINFFSKTLLSACV